MKRLIVKKESYQSIKDDEKFLGAIQYNNVIYTMLIGNKEYDTYLQLHSVIYHVSLLYRGIKKFNTIRRNKTELENLESFKRNNEIINKYFDENNPFFNDVINQISRKVAFHFDQHIIIGIHANWEI